MSEVETLEKWLLVKGRECLIISDDGCRAGGCECRLFVNGLAIRIGLGETISESIRDALNRLKDSALDTPNKAD